MKTKAETIKIQDRYNSHKIHSFRFYKDRHVTYNQEYSGRPYYKKFVRVNEKFGYGEYLKAARVIRKG